MVLIFLLAGTVAILALVGYLVVRLYAPSEEMFYFFRCPACGQKLRYLAHKAGRSAICPRCRRSVTLPATPQSVAKPESPAHSYPVGRRLVS